MASDIAAQHLFANQKLKLYDHDPGATTAIIVSPDGGTTLRVADMKGDGTPAGASRKVLARFHEGIRQPP